MITNGYEKQKSIVMDYYAKYKALIDALGYEEKENIKEEAYKIENEIFNLMIIGEAKSGKSTFINAFLGQDILPMDVLQCTSAIIKIRSGKSLKLIATMAGNGKKEMTSDVEIKKFLMTNAAIPDTYRQLPFVQIDEFIIQMNKKKRDINNRSIESFIENLPKSGLGVSEKEYKKLVNKYISERKKDWESIVTSIEIIFPLKKEFSGITIFDSPGVGAKGYVGELTEKCIDDANAIIFVKALTGQAIESSSFVNFFTDNCKDKQKENLFLVFTNCANVEENDLPRYKQQAIKYYGNFIDSKKMAFVDSKIELYLNHCNSLGSKEKINEYFLELEEQKKEYVPASYSWFKSFGDVTKFGELMSKKSNFADIRNVLEKYAYRANFIQLKNFLESINAELKSYKQEQIHLKELLLTDLENEKKLEDAIAECNEEISDTKAKVDEGLEKIHTKFVSGDTDEGEKGGVITQKKLELISEYKEKLKPFCSLNEYDIDSNTYFQLKNMTIDAIEKAHKYQKAIAKDLIEKCDEQLIAITNIKDLVSYELVRPVFTESDFEALKNKAEDETEEFIEGGCFRKDRWIKHPEKVVEILIDHISEAIEEIGDKMCDRAIDFADNCLAEYKKKLSLRITQLDKQHKNLMDIKDDNEKKREKVKFYQKLIKQIDEHIDDNVLIVKGIDGYVK